MKKILIILVLLISCAGHAQVLRPMTPRYSNSSIKGNIVFVANNIVTSAGGGTGEVPPAGSSTNNGSAGVNINIDGTTFIPYGSAWKYWANTMANYQNNWQTVAYNDAAWPSGNGELGYGDGDEATCIPSGGTGTLCLPTGNKWGSYYFRYVVNIPNPALFSSYTFNVERDDGFVLYINGVEYQRNNMPAGAVAYNTPASAAVEDAIISFTVPNTAFVTGNNTIAVEMHQNPINAGGLSTSSDISFNLELKGTDPAIFNASSADLSLPSCSQVLFAGLYWGASQGTDGTNTSWIVNETQVKLKVPGSSSYTNLTSTQTDYHNGTLVPGLPHTGYRCFRDITSLVNATSPNGTYTIANVCSPSGINNASGGWTIVIAYSDPATITRNLTVYDGSVIMNGGDPALHIPIYGFLTPPSGPVSCELGAVVFDGDRVSTDEFSFKQDSNQLVGSYTSMTPNATANLNDMWNSTISYKGSIVTTRNPAHNNTLGYDADIIVVPNAGNAVLGNNQSTASIRFSSPSENYMLQVATTSISQYTPIFDLRKSATDVNGGSLAPGDIIRYQLDYINDGNDNSTNTTITDRVPFNTTYKPGSITINGVAKTDAVGDDEAEYDIVSDRVIFRLGTGADGSTGGEIAPSASGNVRFEVYTSSSCLVFSCAGTITNRARIGYGGKLSGISLFDSSGITISGCSSPNPVSSTLSGTCSNPGDTILINICPATSVTIPVAQYGGYRFYSGIPFTSGNLFNPATPISATTVIYAFYNGPGSCDDTIRINVYRIGCPDIDDDDDGLPDYLELNNPAALADQDGDGIPNWADPTPGAPIVWVDNNVDGSNDWFDPSADADNDGIPNFYDTNFPGYIDTNGDGVNDNMDKDKDGIPNNLDLDSDNDGIPDTAESFGVDANGDGRIDNYSDSDADGLSQNVDASGPGANFIYGSGLGLGALDTDGDGIPNYLDLDSDNDGIPDITEAFGTDAANSARVGTYADTDGDGYTDALDADVGNDLVAENSSASLLRTSSDANNDGRADSWPYKNMDSDSKPNPYDLDSDDDGITDVKEAQFTDADWNGRVDGAVNTDGRNSALAALPSLSIPNTDGAGRTNPYDIDSDDDGIPDNVEGLTTLGYLMPGTTDTDNDGLINTYDNFAGFGGDGIHPVDTDGDSIPDYMDSDTDSDGLIDRIEGNDLNFNATPDDNVTLTGSDTDGDGLDNRFDANNSSIEGTSAYMGTGGTTSGDPTPGSITTVQHTWIANANGCPVERDWRCITYVLSCEFTTFRAVLYNQQVKLDWTALCRQEVDHFVVQRSTDGITFSDITTVQGRPNVNEAESYAAIDNNITGISTDKIYYRLVSKSVNGKSKTSNVIIVRLNSNKSSDLQVLPNPVKSQLQVLVTATASSIADVVVSDANGRTVMQFRERILPGNNSFTYPEASTLPAGTYYLRLSITGENMMTRRFSVVK